MFRQLLVLAVLAVAALSAPIEKVNDIPEEYKALMPKDIAEVFNSLTSEESSYLEDLMMNRANHTIDEMMASLMLKSPSAFQKVVKIRALIAAKVDALGEEAGFFVFKIVTDARQYLENGKVASVSEIREKLEAHTVVYDALSMEAKTKLWAQFPALGGLYEHKKFESILQAHRVNPEASLVL